MAYMKQGDIARILSRRRESIAEWLQRHMLPETLQAGRLSPEAAVNLNLFGE